MVKSDNGNDFDFQAMQANFSSLLYIITEQHSLIGKLLGQLLESGVLSPEQLRKITDIHADKEELHGVYSELHKRFVWYFMRTSDLLGAEEERIKDEPTDGK